MSLSGRGTLAAICALAAVVIIADPAKARKSKKYCQGGKHLHFGSGTGSSKKAASRNAIASWAGFTAFEYGNAYAYWRHARFKRNSCNRSGSGWSCSVSANPCRVTR